MASDTLRRRSPLEPLSGELAARANSRFSCNQEPFRILTDVRCAPNAVPVAASAFGATPPGIGAFKKVGARTILSLGERWWLVDAPDSSSLLLESEHISAVNVSAQYVSLRLRGTCVRDVLAHGVPIDLHASHFRQGAVVQTLLAKARMILARIEPNEYQVRVQASYARYVAHWLLDASVEYRSEH